MKKGKTSWHRVIFTFFFFTFSLFFCYGQVASRADGGAVIYYDSLQEAVFAAKMSATADTVSIDSPDEITLLADIILDAPLIIDDGVHIRLVVSGDRIIQRSANLIEFPVLWVRGDSASLSLGKPGMEHELVVDGGFLNSSPIEAHCPLVTISGPDAKLIMYDKVTLQNNKNSGSPLGNSDYENGSGVFIRTEGDLQDRQVEFIMKGGTIRGNINNVRNPYACGGGVYISGYGIFTMEGGVIMNNTARITGGGFHTGGRGSFTKTGGIIYGSNAPAALRNKAIEGTGSPKTYGHAVCVAFVQPPFQYRNDTVTDNDNLSFTIPIGLGYHVYGEGEKWDDPDKAFRRILLAIILPVLSLAVCGFLILRKKYQKKLMKLAQEAADQSANTGADAMLDSVFENAKLNVREKEIGKLLLTKLTMKQIASFLKTPYTTADYHVRKVYRKLGVQGRTELIIRMRNEKGEGKSEQREVSNEQGIMSNE